MRREEDNISIEDGGSQRMAAPSSLYSISRKAWGGSQTDHAPLSSPPTSLTAQGWRLSGADFVYYRA
jgi:hypothetical protein